MRFPIRKIQLILKMRPIVYYVATSLDGYICGPDEDISGFVGQGNGVDKYLSDLKNFDTVLMGRRTYEFGYRYGLVPGQPAYPHMNNYIFSDHLILAEHNAQVMIKKIDLKEIIKLKDQPGKDIYLCSGGQLAGWLLDNCQIDVLKIKLNPLVLGAGTKIFGPSTSTIKTELINSETYEQGLQIMTYPVIH